MTRGFKKGDDYSDMSRERSRFESDEDYQERMEDLDSMLENLD